MLRRVVQSNGVPFRAAEKHHPVPTSVVGQLGGAFDCATQRIAAGVGESGRTAELGLAVHTRPPVRGKSRQALHLSGERGAAYSDHRYEGAAPAGSGSGCAVDANRDAGAVHDGAMAWASGCGRGRRNHPPRQGHTDETDRPNQATADATTGRASGYPVAAAAGPRTVVSSGPSSTRPRLSRVPSARHQSGRPGFLGGGKCSRFRRVSMRRRRCAGGRSVRRGPRFG